ATRDDGIALAREALTQLTSQLVIRMRLREPRRPKDGHTTLDASEKREAVDELAHNTKDAPGGVVLVVKRLGVGLRLWRDIHHRVIRLLCGLATHATRVGWPIDDRLHNYILPQLSVSR